MTEVARSAQKVLELVRVLSVPAIGLPLAIFVWSLFYKGRDGEGDWAVNLEVSLKIGFAFLLLALSIVLNAAGSEIWFLMRAERLWGVYVVLLTTGTALVPLVSWFKGRRQASLQQLNMSRSCPSEVPIPDARWVTVTSFCITIVIAWSVAFVWLWLISQGS